MAYTESGWVSGCLTCCFFMLAREFVGLGSLAWASHLYRATIKEIDTFNVVLKRNY